MTVVYILLALTLLLSAAACILAAVSAVSAKRGRNESGVERTVQLHADRLLQETRDEGNRTRQGLADVLNVNTTQTLAGINAQMARTDNSVANMMQLERTNAQSLEQKLNAFTSSVETKLERMRYDVGQKLLEARQENEKQLTEMRTVVDEKLSATLEQRFNQSFAVVTKQLEAINHSFLEMQTLQTNVGDLKRIFTDVKKRGTWGEVALESLLSQLLTPEQYGRNVNLSKTENERVDFVINMPGRDSEPVCLPVDSKFPLEDYLRLVELSESGDKEKVDAGSKALERAVKAQAQKIKDKYIMPPKTTDFAIMYLPVEGLFAEVVKRPGLIEELQQRFRVVVCGPTTLSALLNSLQMGFRTVAIEKRSTEIWKLLEQFRKDFSKFSVLLDQTKKRLEGVTSSINKANERTGYIQRRLAKVSDLPTEDGDTDNLLEEDVSDAWYVGGDDDES